jgi:hypothetical protein
MSEISSQGTASIAVETSEREITKMTGIGGSAEKMIAETASEMIGEVDEIDAARQITKEAAEVIGVKEITGKLETLRLCILYCSLIHVRGVPVVGTSEAKSDKSPESKAKREAATAEALAKAKAMVEAQQKKSANSKTEAETKEPTDRDGVIMDQQAKLSEPDAKNSATEGRSKKRAREEDDETGPEAKKVDVSAEPVAANGHS